MYFEPSNFCQIFFLLKRPKSWIFFRLEIHANKSNITFYNVIDMTWRTGAEYFLILFVEIDTNIILSFNLIMCNHHRIEHQFWISYDLLKLYTISSLKCSKMTDLSHMLQLHNDIKWPFFVLYWCFL